ncbi:hypothetical protein KP509_21G041700 [Ceratopteris richardii]|uniref:Nitrate regulatory gene2 protein-like n=1 Tax=Ceratopteris richardii TaxID=49495 RepID=A0A8T2SCD2_CERRI|nr:hypothetical protein KP509_21G041700 [Ceratopteris richardii]KAH7315263.1 hypothetical protein KP509_21G041700 [Ceratopteris richardii]KAH7315264.1 hypothetical protein KP509_21G041700 [Ceratopteris richardii]
MGCNTSKFEREKKSVTSRCRNRELAIRRCVQNHHAFAAAHAAYIRSLRDMGAALRQFGEGGDTKPDGFHGNGLELSLDLVGDDSKQLSHTFGTPYFPPPLPNFLTPSFLSRMSALPQFNFSSPHALSLAKSLVFTSPRNSFTYSMEENAEPTDSGFRKSYYVKPPPPLPASLDTPPAPPPASKVSQWEFYNVFQLAEQKAADFIVEDEPALETENSSTKQNAEDFKTPPKSQKDSESYPTPTECSKVPPQQKKVDVEVSVEDFSCILKEIDDNFLQAYESGRDVARLLEGQRTHYYSNINGFNGACDHSSRVLRVMSWGRHTQLTMDMDEGVIRSVCGDDKETHASTLDKLLAWERKLYDEVKLGELVRVRLERKSVELKKQKKQDLSSARFIRTKSVVKSLQSRYLVEVQAVDAASYEVQKLRDDRLHSQLIDLVEKLMTMWKAMLDHFERQYRLIEDMQIVDNDCMPASTSDCHIKNTLQLESEINNWHHNLEKLVSTQKNYVSSVHLWLRLHVIGIEGDSKPSEALDALPVYSLCKSWISSLEQIHDNVPLHALKALSNVLQELKLQQTAELKQKRILDRLKRELDRKEHVFKRHESRYKKFYIAYGNGSQKDHLLPGMEIDRNPLKEKEVTLNLLKDKVETERDKYEQMCTKSGNMALSILQKGLPPVLNAMRDFAQTCFQVYTELALIAAKENGPLLQISY